MPLAGVSLRLAARGEKFPEQLRGFPCQHSANHRGAVIELRMVEHRKAGTHGAPFDVVRPVYQPRDPRLNHRAGAHRARFDRDVDGGFGQPVVFNGARGFAQRDDFGVRGGIAIRDGSVSGAGYDALADHHSRANGHLAPIRRGTRFVKRGSHVEFVGGVVLLFHGESE